MSFYFLFILLEIPFLFLFSQLQHILVCRSSHVLCLYAFVNASFADPKLSKKYGTHDIEAPLIAQKFKSISGQKIYGTVSWRKWCTLERTLGDETMSWLGTVCTSNQIHNAETGVSNWPYGGVYKKPDGGMHHDSSVQDQPNWVAN